MLGVLLAVLRYLFLFLLYLFLFLLVRLMYLGLREEAVLSADAGRQVPAPVPSGRQQQPSAGSGGSRLVVLASPDPGLQAGMNFPLGENTSLGRGTKNDLVIADPFASLEHAHIFSREGQYWLEDLGSLNGTYLNEVRLERPTVLADGDRVRIGGVTFQFVRWAYEMESCD
ncbi:FHA domain-containing protein [Desulfotomaculum copahuensis]|uniref:FHA domain-containing protein n=1 Tax=Desulfotomaculum copahuensis TaxID=1838280 RepID=A0A1B7LEC9_9FIRM|nr:FHA domain-containing protein [Desulfotomaculum copahuensis]OAT81414.1 hypothetical protein A6M21_11125 [Desulfotomaculum copahuensis]